MSSQTQAYITVDSSSISAAGNDYFMPGARMPPQTKEPIMKYLCLVYVEEHVLNGLPKPERHGLL